MMKLIILSIICSAVIGACVAVFLRVVKVFDKRYEEFEDERYRAAAGPGASDAQTKSGNSASHESPR